MHDVMTSSVSSMTSSAYLAAVVHEAGNGSAACCVDNVLAIHLKEIGAAHGCHEEKGGQAEKRRRNTG